MCERLQRSSASAYAQHQQSANCAGDENPGGRKQRSLDTQKGTDRRHGLHITRAEATREVERQECAETGKQTGNTQHGSGTSGRPDIQRQPDQRRETVNRFGMRRARRSVTANAMTKAIRQAVPIESGWFVMLRTGFSATSAGHDGV